MFNLMFCLILMFSNIALLAKGDSLFALLKYEEALKVYETAYRENSGDYETLWRLAMVYLSLGEELKDKKVAQKNYDLALSYAKKATKVNPDGDWGWTFFAAVNGVTALSVGGKEKVKYAMIIKEAVNKALSINPNNDLANFIWGSYNFEAATLNPMLRSFAKTIFGEVPEGTIENAEKYIKKATLLNPARIQYHYELARVYEYQEKIDEAKNTLRKAISLKPQIREDIKYLEKAKKMLQKLEK
ncbi:MAG: tetratricopeptide repeat protein [Candidatus Hydrothermia bacterium]